MILVQINFKLVKKSRIYLLIYWTDKLIKTNFWYFSLRKEFTTTGIHVDIEFLGLKTANCIFKHGNSRPFDSFNMESTHFLILFNNIDKIFESLDSKYTEGIKQWISIFKRCFFRARDTPKGSRKETETSTFKINRLGFCHFSWES